MRVTVIRHGETDWNTARRVQGHSDIPLNETGLAQARAAGDALKALGCKYDLVYSSDLSRAYQTASIICEATGSPMPEKIVELRERNMGNLEGQLIEEAWNTHPHGKSKHNTHFGDSHPAHIDFVRDDIISSSGESIADTRQRLSRAYDMIVKHAEGKGVDQILIVGHGMALKTMLTSLVQSKVLKTHLPHGLGGSLKNCSITTIVDNEIVSYNETVTETRN